jgi:hypothetical protein
MRVINHTHHLVETFAARHPKDAATLRVVVVKGSFSIPSTSGGSCKPSPPVEFLHEDTFVGDPGITAPRLEEDFSIIKSRCDVIVVGHAYSPCGPTTDGIPAGLKLGNWQKIVGVFGARHWKVGLIHTSISAAEPWVKASLGYEGAFGGTAIDPESGALSAYMANPVGKGYFEIERLADQQPLPWLQAMDAPVTKPSGQYSPQSLGVLPRNTSGRSPFAGTYDAHWKAERFPDLPEDFDLRFFQCTASDQWIDPPRGGEEVGFLNLMPVPPNAGTAYDGILRFQLPDLQLPISCMTRSGGRQDLPVMLDTLIFEPDEQRFSAVWRTHVRLGRDQTALTEIEIGTRPLLVPARGHVVNIPIDRIGRSTKLASPINDIAQATHDGSKS